MKLSCKQTFYYLIINDWPTREHSGTSRQHSVGVKVFPDVNITFHDGVVTGLMNSCSFHTNEGWLEHGFWASEPLISDGDDLTIRKFVALLQGRGGSSCLHFLFKVQGNVTEFLLDVTDNFTLSSCGERVATLCQDLQPNMNNKVSKLSLPSVTHWQCNFTISDCLALFIWYFGSRDNVAYSISFLCNILKKCCLSVQLLQRFVTTEWLRCSTDFLRNRQQFWTHSVRNRSVGTKLSEPHSQSFMS